MTATAAADVVQPRGFNHDVLFYAGMDDFLAGTVPFIETGLAANEAVLVAVAADKIGAIRDHLGPCVHDVRFVDMETLGRNPARIIPAWQEFVDNQAAIGCGFPWIGEPIWPGRSPAELVECHLHESLLNVAFAGGPTWSLLCPYDRDGLDATVVADAHGTHPHVAHVTDRFTRSPNRHYREVASNPFDRALPAPPGNSRELSFGHSDLRGLRSFVVERGHDAGLDPTRVDDLVLAVSEVATNSIRHGAGHGVLRIWRDDKSLMCDISDEGDARWAPLVGRVLPSCDQPGGRGMWLANQLCDLVQIRSGPDGTVVRLHVRSR